MLKSRKQRRHLKNASKAGRASIQLQRANKTLKKRKIGGFLAGSEWSGALPSGKRARTKVTLFSPETNALRSPRRLKQTKKQSKTTKARKSPAKSGEKYANVEQPADEFSARAAIVMRCYCAYVQAKRRIPFDQVLKDTAKSHNVSVSALKQWRREILDTECEGVPTSEELLELVQSKCSSVK